MSNPKRVVHQDNNFSKELILHQHDELIKVNHFYNKIVEAIVLNFIISFLQYVNEAWHKVSQMTKNFSTFASIVKRFQFIVHQIQEQPHGVTYYKNLPEPRLAGFKAFDLESWWGRRVFNQKTSQNEYTDNNNGAIILQIHLTSFFLFL